MSNQRSKLRGRITRKDLERLRKDHPLLIEHYEFIKGRLKADRYRFGYLGEDFLWIYRSTRAEILALLDAMDREKGGD